MAAAVYDSYPLKRPKSMTLIKEVCKETKSHQKKEQRMVIADAHKNRAETAAQKFLFIRGSNYTLQQWDVTGQKFHF